MTPAPSPTRRPSFRASCRRLAAGVACVATANLVPIGTAQADVADKMNDFFRDAGTAANVTGPSAYQGQSAGYYTGGNLWSRFPQKNVQPFNLQMPSVRAGCGGIDVFAGSFSFINASEMVAMLKATANNAVGFAFKLAIDSVSPQISKVMGEFSQAAQQMNQMNISSCEAAQGLVGGIWPKMDGARSTICAAVGQSSGRFSDWARSRQGCGPEGEREATLAANTDAATRDLTPGTPRNYTWEALRRSSAFGSTRAGGTGYNFDPGFSEYIMTVVGTVITNVNSTDGSGIRYFGPAEEAVVTALLDGTAGATPVEVLKCDTEDLCLNPTKTSLTVPATVALRQRVRTMIVSMNDKIRTDRALDNAEKQLLNMTSLPLYKMLMVQALAHSGFTSDELDTLAEIVSVNLLSAIIDNMLDRVGQASVHIPDADQTTAETWRRQLAEAREKYSRRDYRIKDTVMMTTALINRSVMLESTLQNALSPGLSASLNFSRGLSAQGLN